MAWIRGRAWTRITPCEKTVGFLRIAEQRRAQKSRASPEELLPGTTGRIMMLEFSDLVFARHEFPDELYHRRLHKISPGHSP